MKTAEETRPVVLTRAEADAVLDALQRAVIAAAMNGETCHAETAAGRKIAALWTEPKRRRPA